MELNNNTVDIISIILILMSVILSYSRGLIRECLTIIAWILSFISSIQLGPTILPLILNFPFLEEFLLGNCPLAMLFSYVITFLLSLTFFSIVIAIFNISKTTELHSVWSSIDKLGGVLFGFIKSIIMLLLILILIQDFLPDFKLKNKINDSINESMTSKLLMPSKNYLYNFISKNGQKWLTSTYTFVLKNECK